MLPRPARLPKAAIPALLRLGRTLAVPPLSLRYRPADAAKPSRFAFVISSKKAKRAVERNRIKRRARAIVRRHLAALQPGFEVMIFLDPSLGRGPFGAAEQKIVSLLQRAKII